MSIAPVEINIAIRPQQRYELIDVTRRVREEAGDVLSEFRKTVYCSLHTTAGYLEQGACRRLGQTHKQLDPFIRAVQKIFPHDAGYYHDRMQLRGELSESEKEREPINADSHLTFMSAGLNNCVTYINRPDESVYFIELDGVYKQHVRQRRTTVIGYNQAEVVHRDRIAVPVAEGRTIDSFNLKDDRYGLFSELEGWLQRYGVEKGRFDLRLVPEDRHVGLTVNEYETLLMRNDLPQALRDPLRYMVQRGKKLLRYPSVIPGKTRDYAAYDLIHLYNDLMDSVPVGRSVIDRFLSVLSSPAKRILRLKRHVSLLVSDGAETGTSRIVQGQYQSPILVQHHPATNGVRHLDVTLRKFA